LELVPNLLAHLIQEHEMNNDGLSFRSNGKLKQVHIRQLKAKVRHLEINKNIFKKANMASTNS